MGFGGKYESQLFSPSGVPAAAQPGDPAGPRPQEEQGLQRQVRTQALKKKHRTAHLSTKRQNEVYSEVWKLLSQNSTDVTALQKNS